MIWGGGLGQKRDKKKSTATRPEKKELNSTTRQKKKLNANSLPEAPPQIINGPSLKMEYKA